MKLFTKNKKEVVDAKKKAVQEWMPVTNIQSIFAYVDGKIISYIEIEQINLDLLTEDEQDRVILKLDSVLSNIEGGFCIYAQDVPIDLNQYIDFLNQCKEKANLKKRLILDKYISSVINDMMGATAKKYFIVLKGNKEKELEKKTMMVHAQLEEQEFPSKILGHEEICKLYKQFAGVGGNDEKN